MISIHALRVEGDLRVVVESLLFQISIHALRVEGDFTHVPDSPGYMTFQSTPSVWRATGRCFLLRAAVSISIHALRVEGDVADGAVNLFDDISIHALRVEGDLRLPPALS